MSRKKIESTLSHPLVAIDMGSHSIRSMAAERTGEGLLRILGADASSRKLCVERGVVINTSDASYSISESMKLLANRIQYPILMNSFVAIGGRSMKIVEVTSCRDQVHKREIPQELLEDMDAECKQKIEARNAQVAVLALVPYCYVLDGVAQAETPESTQHAARIEVKYVAFVGIKELEQKVLDSFIRTPKKIERTYARPDALLCALATEEDLHNGCAILDMGAQTTTLTIFKGDKYLYNKVVSQGGYDITRDIEQLGMSFAYAERLKCGYGDACWHEGMDNPCFRVPHATVEGSTVLVRMSELNTTIQSRLHQVLTPLMEDLRHYEQHIAVLYITGGASMLASVDQYIQQLTSVPVIYGSHAPWLTAETPDEFCAPNYSSLVGTLILGALYRETHPIVEPMDDFGKRFKKITKNVQTSILDMFTEQY